MSDERAAPGSPRDWLARAHGDLALAKAPLPEGAYIEDLCFHAQQAAEKALKAVYLHNKWKFRYSHDLDELADVLRKNGIEIPPDVQSALILTSFAWETRYPGPSEPVTEEELKEATGHSEAVVRWAEKMIGGSDTNGNVQV